MGDFGDAERKILSFMVEGTEFEFEDRKYVVELSGKPTCHKGAEDRYLCFGKIIIR